MGTKVIKGRKKGSQETSYFLSHGDAVIMGSGNSKKTLTTKLGEVDGRIDTINGKIPAEASSGNPLADKDYVTTQVGNKTVDTAHIDNGAVTTVKIADGNVTKVKLAQDVLNFLEEYLADFKGTVETTAALKALTGNKNDWAVYKHTDSNNNVIYSRYRYDESYNDATTGKWKFELDINSSAFTAAQWAAINSGVTSTWKLNVENGLISHSESIDGINDALAGKIDGLQIVTAGKDGTPYGVLPEDISLKQFYADSGSKQCPLQVRYVTVNSTGYIVFVGRVHNNIGYIIFAASDNSFVGLGTIAAPTAAHKAILYAAYPEFESIAGLGGYEFDEVDVDTLLS